MTSHVEGDWPAAAHLKRHVQHQQMRLWSRCEMWQTTQWGEIWPGADKKVQCHLGKLWLSPEALFPVVKDAAVVINKYYGNNPISWIKIKVVHLIKRGLPQFFCVRVPILRQNFWFSLNFVQDELRNQHGNVFTLDFETFEMGSVAFEA